MTILIFKDPAVEYKKIIEQANKNQDIQIEIENNNTDEEVVTQEKNEEDKYSIGSPDGKGLNHSRSSRRDKNRKKKLSRENSLAIEEFRKSLMIKSSFV